MFLLAHHEGRQGVLQQSGKQGKGKGFVIHRGTVPITEGDHGQDILKEWHQEWTARVCCSFLMAGMGA